MQTASKLNKVKYILSQKFLNKFRWTESRSYGFSTQNSVKNFSFKLKLSRCF